MSISLSTQLANQVYAVANLAGSLYQDYLMRPLGVSVDIYSKSVIDLLSDVHTVRHNLYNHCHDIECDYSAEETQTLFSILDIAQKSLERIK